MLYINNKLYNEDNQILYVAIELQPDSKLKLIDLFNDYNPWNGKYKIICHHSTIAFGKAVDKYLDWITENNNKEIKLTATEIGFNDKTCAVKVATDFDVPCDNKIRHITLATNIVNNGKPVDSNTITNWESIDKLTLFGNVKIYYK